MRMGSNQLRSVFKIGIVVVILTPVAVVLAYQIILDTFYEETDRSQIEIMTEGDQENANDPGHAGSQTEPADSGDQVDQNEAEGTSEQSGADGAQQETSEDDGRITVDPNILH